MEGTGRQRRRSRQQLDELGEKIRYCEFKEDAVDRCLWRTSLWKRHWNCRKRTCAMNSGVIVTWQVNSLNIFRDTLLMSIDLTQEHLTN